jgi:hypothetical protein
MRRWPRTGAQGLAPFSLESLLLRSSPGLDVLQRLGQQEQVSAFAINVAGALLPGPCRRGSLPTEQHRQSELAVGHRELSLWTGRSLWTRDGLGLPIDTEVFLGEAGPFDGTRVLADRPDYGYPMSSRRPGAPFRV